MPWKWAVSWTLFSLLLRVRCLTGVSSDTDLLLCGSPSETVTAVCKSDLIHRNLGTFSQASPFFRAESNAHFPVLVAVKVQPVSCDRAVRAGNGIRGFKTHLGHGWSSARSAEAPWALFKIQFKIEHPNCVFNTETCPSCRSHPVAVSRDKNGLSCRMFPFKLQVKSSQCSGSDPWQDCKSRVDFVLKFSSELSNPELLGVSHSDTRAGFIFCSLPAH